MCVRYVGTLLPLGGMNVGHEQLDIASLAQNVELL